MINFFRKTRKKLADDNKFFKYWRYAIGEIVLVVVGILIALQINNWNEEKKTLESFNNQLIKVQSELKRNIISINLTIKRYQVSDSLLDIVRSGELTQDIIIENPRAIVNLGHFDRNKVESDEFSNLSEIDIKLTERQDSILNLLKNIYIYQKPTMENSRAVLESMYWSYQEELSESYNWFGTMMSSGVPTNKVIEYCLEDPDYLNRVINLSMNVFSRALPMNLLVREKSISAHRLISNYFNEKDTLLNYHVDEYDHFIGLYQGKNNSIRIENKEGKLYMTVHHVDGTTNPRREIFPISKTCYTASANSGYFYLRLNANNNVEKIVESLGLKKFEFIKIE